MFHLVSSNLQWVIHRIRQAPVIHSTTDNTAMSEHAYSKSDWDDWRCSVMSTQTQTHTQRSLHLQLHHGVLAQLVPACGCHLINPNQLGLVAHAISAETLNKPRLTAVLTCRGRERETDKSWRNKNERVITGNEDVWAQLNWTRLVRGLLRLCVGACVFARVSLCSGVNIYGIGNAERIEN